MSADRRGLLGAGAVLAGAVALSAASAPAAQALSDTSVFPGLRGTSSPAWHLARRASFSSTADLAAQIRAMGSRAWIEKQLNPDAIADTRVEAMIAKHFPAAAFTSGPQVMAFTNSRPWETAPTAQKIVMLRQQFSERHLKQMMVEFASDQVYVSVLGRGDSFALLYGEQVLQKHAMGKFSDFLKAAIRHPAVLVNLDNHRSTKANPNENLGRELLELHTTGAGNYTEAHVRSSALALTGHGVDWATLEYRYTPSNHHVGPVQVMGWSHPNSSADPAAASAMLDSYLDYLARHPATARRLMTRLARRFVSDQPPAALIDRLVGVYQSSDTAMVPVLRYLLGSLEFITSIGCKVRRPQESLASMNRGRRVGDFVPAVDPKAFPYSVMGTHSWLLSSMNHGIREWPYVDGFPDVASPWISTSVLRATWNAAEAVMGDWDADEFPRPALAATYGIKAGATVYAAARTLCETITGWKWEDPDIAPVASMLANKGASAVSSTAVLTQSMVDTNLRFAARLVASSPHFLAR